MKRCAQRAQPILTSYTVFLLELLKKRCFDEVYGLAVDYYGLIYSVHLVVAVTAEYEVTYPH